MELNKDTLWGFFKSYMKTKDESIPIIKKFEDEKMEAIEILYCKPMEADAHDEGMTEEEIRKMVSNFNQNIDKIKGNIGHIVNIDGFKPLKAWVNECDCYIGDEFVPEGMPLVKTKFTDVDLWEKRKAGLLKGVSIGARGVKVDISEE